MDLSRWFTDVVYRRPIDSNSATPADLGEPSYGPSERIPCRWEPGRRIVLAADGKERATVGALTTDRPIVYTDLLFLPPDNGDDVSTGLEPIEIRSASLFGLTHYKVTIG